MFTYRVRLEPLRSGKGKTVCIHASSESDALTLAKAENDGYRAVCAVFMGRAKF